MDRVEALMLELREFVAEREWQQFHDPKNLAMALGSEAGELMAELRWVASGEADEYARQPDNRQGIEDELGDVGILAFLLADRLGLDLLDLMRKKLAKNALKYPKEASRGSATPPRSEPEP